MREPVHPGTVIGAAWAAAAMLASCGAPSEGENGTMSGNGAAAKEAAAGENATGGKPPAAAMAGGERFVGRWSADGDCAHFMELRSDGVYADYNGTPGTWRPAGEHIEVYLGEVPIIVEPGSLTRC